MLVVYRQCLVKLAARPQTLVEAGIDRQTAYAMLNFGWIRCDKRIWSLTLMGLDALQ